MNEFYNQLNVGQITNTLKSHRQYIAKYFAMWSDYGMYDKHMVTLSPYKNTPTSAIELRNEFIKKLNNRQYTTKDKLAYFSAIECGLNQNPISKETQAIEQYRIEKDGFNWHVHIQLLTTMSVNDIQKVLDRIDCSKCIYKKLTPFDKEKYNGQTFDYVIKELSSINWEKIYYLKNRCKGLKPFTSSRKDTPDYIIKKLFHYFQTFHKKEWNSVHKHKRYEFLMYLKNKDQIILGNVSHNIKPLKGYCRIVVKDKTIDIDNSIFSKKVPSIYQE